MQASDVLTMRSVTVHTPGWASAYNDVYLILADTARLRNRPLPPAAFYEICSKMARVVLFWRLVFEEDGQYEDFPKSVHAYDPLHALAIVCESALGYSYDDVVYVPRLDSPLLPTPTEIAAIRPNARRLTPCRLLFKRRIQFYHDVTLPDRHDPRTFSVLGTVDRTDKSVDY